MSARRPSARHFDLHLANGEERIFPHVGFEVIKVRRAVELIFGRSTRPDIGARFVRGVDSSQSWQFLRVDWTQERLQVARRDAAHRCCLDGIGRLGSRRSASVNNADTSAVPPAVASRQDASSASTRPNDSPAEPADTIPVHCLVSTSGPQPTIEPGRRRIETPSGVRAAASIRSAKSPLAGELRSQRSPAEMPSRSWPRSLRERRTCGPLGATGPCRGEKKRKGTNGARIPNPALGGAQVIGNDGR